MKKMLWFQKAMLRLMTLAPPRLSCKIIVKSLNILTAYLIYLFYVLYAIITSLYTNKEEYFAQSYEHIYITRQKSKTFQYTLHKTKQLEISSLHSVCKKIPNDRTWRGFHSLKVFLIKRAYYLIAEFFNDNIAVL